MESRTKNATRNIVFGIVLKVYQIIVPFVIRTIMIYFMGIEYLGLNSFFISVLQVLNLAELGVGSAMVFSMYKPIAKKNNEKICALLKLYKNYYRLIGTIILIIGLLITPFIPYLIKSDIPSNVNIYIVYILNLLLTAISYWLFAYKNSILQAHQRLDITSKITLFSNSIQYILQIIVIIFFRDYYIYIIISLITQVVNNLTTAYVSNKMFPNYKPYGELDKKEIKKINKRVKDLFSSRVGAIILNSSDSIVISSFLGLSMLATYQNYFYIVSALYGITVVFLNSFTAGIGNSLIVENEEKNYKDLNKITFLMTWGYGLISCELLVLFQNFMTLWVGEAFLLKYGIVVLLVLYYYIYSEIQILCTYKDAAGMWHSDRLRPLVTGIVNLITNIILIHFIGLFGVVLSTIISLIFIGYPWLVNSLFKEVFKKEGLKKEYLLHLGKYTLTSIILGIILTLMSRLIIINNTIISFVLKGALVFLFYNIIWILLYKKTDIYQKSMEKINYILRKNVGRKK